MNRDIFVLSFVLMIVIFFSGETATCMYNSPHEEESLPRVLPGKLLSLDAQCRKDRGTSACFKDDRVCAQLFCFDAGSGYCVSYRPAAEGSRCGDGFVSLKEFLVYKLLTKMIVKANRSYHIIFVSFSFPEYCINSDSAILCLL